MYSIVIPTYNRHADLYRCLDGLAEYFSPASTGQAPFTVEVIVSDDARQKELQASLASNYPWVRYFEGPSRGPAANRNNGAARATGDWLVFTDDDCIPGKGWIHEFHAHRQEAPVLEGKTIADRPRQRLDEESPLNSGGYLWSCNFAIEKPLFDSLGGFDENFPFAAMEDMDLKKRIDDAPAKIVYVPEAVIVHPWRRSRGVSFWNKHQMSELYFWNKHKTLAPPSLWKYYAYIGLRSFIKSTIPGAIEYRGRGMSNAIAHDAWLFTQSLKFLIRRPR
ncbi:glycosyltransferase [Variovorax sp. J22P168]|uniref:glycosyltransferase family 2 protein n=1 Tax=Variovorax jilinensis TaxID=3053513 RepID=UPI00257672D7|nr:glycosyltransferase [Variovorax sp. J22P168]MDM0011270.1 glycosyltransferase [Variovorax sp. J22P168]